MSNQLQIETCERVFAILQTGVPKLFEAQHYVEKENRITPYPIFIESRDVLSHLRDIAKNATSKENIEKNLIEIEEHLRRGIAETYQEHYEFLTANIFRLYGKYRNSFVKFEKLMGLRKKHEPLHVKIRATLKKAQTLWMEGRNLKNNDLNSEEFTLSVEKFKQASDLVSSIDSDVDIIFNNFYKRAIITTFITLFSLSIVLILLLKVYFP